MKVDFVIGGTQKGGTTALAQFVAAHPEVAFSSAKETHFFDDEARFAAAGGGQGAADLDAYHAFFDAGPRTVAVGEATPIYMYWNACPDRIHAYNPDMKWIVLLRDPVERAYSHWVMESRRGDDDLPFGQALRAEPDRLAKAGGQHRNWSYVDRGRYTAQLERLFARFGPEQVLVLLTDELRDRHAETLTRVWDFLGVTRRPVPAERVFAQNYPAMEPTDRAWLGKALAEEVVRLEVLLGRQLPAWRGSLPAERPAERPA